MTDSLLILISVVWLGAIAACVSEQPWATKPLDRLADWIWRT